MRSRVLPPSTSHMQQIRQIMDGTQTERHDTTTQPRAARRPPPAPAAAACASVGGANLFNFCAGNLSTHSVLYTSGWWLHEARCGLYCQ